MKSLITINSTIPHSGPAAPVIVFFDDGRWEIAHDGDVHYITHGPTSGDLDPSFIAAPALLPLLDDWLAIIELPHLVTDDTNTALFLNQTVDVGRWDEPVIVLFADGDAEVTDRETAEQSATDDEDFVNFISIDDLVSDLREFVADFHAKDIE